MTRAMAMMGIGGLLAAMSACAASDEPQVFVLRATGADVDEAEVSYTVDGEEETQVVSLPWRLEVEIDGAFDIDLTVTNPTDVGTVGCGIELGPGSPEVVGEVAATCTTTGRTGSDTTRIESAAEAVDREPLTADRSGAGTGDDGASTVETGPLQVSLELRDGDGNAVAAPVDGGGYKLVLVVAGVDREVTVDHASELDDGETVFSDDGFTRFEVEDADDGVLDVGIRSWEVATTERHVWTVSGTVSASDDSYEAPYELELRFTPVAFVEGSPTPFALADGSLTAVLPGTWRVVESIDEPTTFVELMPLVDTLAFDFDSSETVAAFEHATEDSSLIVYRLLRPLAAASPEQMVDEMIPVLVDGGMLDYSTEAVELDGHPGVRIDARGTDGRYLFDLVPVAREYFVVRTFIALADPSVDDAEAARASLVIDESRLQPLTHRIACTTTYDPGDVAPSSFTVYAPADWLAPTDSTSGVVCEAASGGDGVQAFSRRVSGITMDEMIEGALGNAGYAVGDVGVTQTTVGSLPAVRISFPDETILWVVVMTEEVGTVLVIDAGDVALNDAMAASVAVAE